MASSRPSSATPDTVDVAEVLRAFETMNNVRLVITIRPCREPAPPGFWLEGKALSTANASGVRTLLAFESVTCGSEGIRNLDAATLQLLYALDFKLGEREWARVSKK